MPIARFEMPDGRIARFEVAEGTTPEQAQTMIAQQVSGSASPTAGQAGNGAYDRFLENLRNPQTGNGRGVFGPALVGGAGELVRGVGALTQFAFPEAGSRIAEVGEALTEGAKSVNPVSGTVGQIGSYVLPFSGAQKAVSAVGNLPAVQRMTNMIPSFAKSTGQQAAINVAKSGGQQAAIGAGTGYALTPDEAGRGESAAFGAIGGAGGELIKPIVKAGGTLASEVLGNFSGVGSQAYKTAYNAAVEGGDKLKALAANLRKQAPMENVVDDALLGLNNMGKNLQNQYRSGMVNVKNDKTVLDFDGIDKALNDAQNLGVFKGKVTNQSIVDEVAKVKTIINDWKSQNPKDFHTPEGMDELKKTIGIELEKIPFEQKTLRKAVGGIYSSVRDEIKKQAPVYDDVMKNYSEGLDYASELKKSLSLGNKASVDTSLRKLQSVMRNDVNTNYGNRVNYAEMLEEASGKPIMAQLAGQSLSTLTPRGLQKLLPSITGAGAYALNPMLLAALPAQSPRLMGEATILAGKASRPVINLANSGTPEQRKLAKLLIMKAAERGTENE
jgi:hypothetical protein